MFDVHCDELIRGLAKRAETVRQRLVQRVTKDHLEANKALVHNAPVKYACTV